MLIMQQNADSADVNGEASLTALRQAAKYLDLERIMERIDDLSKIEPFSRALPYRSAVRLA